MDKNLPDIEDLFRSNLDDNEETPPKRIWNHVEQVLDKDNISNIKRKYRNLKHVAVLLVVLLAGLTFFELNNRYSDTSIHKENMSANKKFSKSETFDKRTNKNRINRTDSLKMTKYLKSGAANSKSGVSKDDFPNAHGKSVETVKTNYNLINDLERRHPHALQKSGFLSQRAAGTADMNKRGSMQCGNLAIDRMTRPINEKRFLNNKSGVDQAANNKMLANKRTSFYDKDHLITFQGRPFVPKINTPVKSAGGINVRIIDSVKLQQSVTLSLPVTTPVNFTGIKKNEIKRTGKASPLSASLFFSPDLAWYSLQEDVPDNRNADANKIEKSEQHKFSSSVGALIDYQLNQHWVIQSGITFSNTVITIEPKIIYAQADNSGSVKYRFNTSSGYSYVLPSFSSSPSIGDSLNVFSSTNTLKYIGVPIAVKFYVERKKFNFNSVVGISANFLIRGKIETLIENGIVDESEVITNINGLKSAYFSALAGVGSEYHMTKNLVLTLTPILKLAMTSINKGSVVKSYPNSFNIAAGIRLKF